MPFGGEPGDAKVAAAVADGTLAAGDLLVSAGRVIDLAVKARDAARGHTRFRRRRSRCPPPPGLEIAAQAVVLLRNDGDLLPLGPDDGIAVIGALAAEPCYQGGGSSHVNATRVDALIELFVPVLAK